MRAGFRPRISAAAIRLSGTNGGRRCIPWMMQRAMIPSGATISRNQGRLYHDRQYRDLRARYAYYHTNWLSYSGVDATYRATVAAVTTKTLMDVYNRQAADSGLVMLHVGLYKAGAGTLALTVRILMQAATSQRAVRLPSMVPWRVMPEHHGQRGRHHQYDLEAAGTIARGAVFITIASCARRLMGV